MQIMRIREIRELHGMPQVKLADNMGVTQSVISNWETGVALPRTRQLPDLAKVLGCSIDELFVPESASPMDTV